LNKNFNIYSYSFPGDKFSLVYLELINEKKKKNIIVFSSTTFFDKWKKKNLVKQ